MIVFRSVLRILALVCLATGAFWVSNLTPTAGAQADKYHLDDAQRPDQGEPQAGQPVNDPSDDPPQGGEPGPGEPLPPPPPLEEGECRDPRVIPEGHGLYDFLAEEAGPRPGEDYVLVANWCANFRINGGAREGQYQDAHWTETPPEPADLEAALLQELYEDVRGALPAPVVSTNPDAGNAAIVHVPVFVSVANWPDGGTFVDSSDIAATDGTDDGGCPTPGEVCAMVTAEATLWYDPGEPGVEPFTCVPPGVPFDPYVEDGDPFIQAERDAACTHDYDTATEGEETWPAQVEIHWTLTGYRGSTGVEEDLGTAITVQAIPRDVNEVHAVVTD